MSDGPSLGAQPASRADFVSTATTASNAVIRIAGETAVTPLTGRAFFNASTSPPVAGATAEIARLDVQLADMFLGGSVGATIRNIVTVHRSRIRGTFTDSRNFRFEPGSVDLVVTVQTQGSEGDPSEPSNILATNTSPGFGVLDRAAGTMSIDTTAVDGMGNSIDVHFQGTLVQPPDSDHDGIIDAVDRCPGSAPGPDRTPPAFTFVPPALTISTCTGVNVGQAQATDSCGVTISNDAPSRFPLGTTVVRWKARDNAGNEAFAAQTVTAVLGDSTSCCPVGSNVIIGTSNNDVLIGTPGVDCILGRGGQDQISGGAGNDFISGGDGDDTISGQGGNDWIFGGTGQDVISGGDGNDTLFGGDGVDRLNGNDGDDRFYGGQGGDILRGDVGNDFLSGEADDDQIYGGVGADFLEGGPGNDLLYGEAGNDSLNGGLGDDRMDGGSGINGYSDQGGTNQCIDNSIVVVCEQEDD